MPVELLPKELKNLALDRDAIIKSVSTQQQAKLLEQMGVEVEEIKKSKAPEQLVKSMHSESSGEELYLIKRKIDRLQELVYRLLYLLNEKIEQDKKFFKELKESNSFSYSPTSQNSENSSYVKEEKKMERPKHPSANINSDAVKLENFFKFTS